MGIHIALRGRILVSPCDYASAMIGYYPSLSKSGTVTTKNNQNSLEAQDGDSRCHSICRYNIPLTKIPPHPLLHNNISMNPPQTYYTNVVHSSILSTHSIKLAMTQLTPSLPRKIMRLPLNFAEQKTIIY